MKTPESQKVFLGERKRMFNHSWGKPLNNWRDVEKGPKNVPLEENEVGGTEEV